VSGADERNPEREDGYDAAFSDDDYRAIVVGLEETQGKLNDLVERLERIKERKTG
jgi:hypothetical protein